MIKIEIKNNPTEEDLDEFKSKVNLAFKQAGSTTQTNIIKKKTVLQKILKFIKG